MMNSETNFRTFYDKKLVELGLLEGTSNDQTVIGKKRRFLGLFPQQPRVVGIVLEKPQQNASGITGSFRVIAGLRGRVWDLAEAIEKELGRDSEVEVNPHLPW